MIRCMAGAGMVLAVCGAAQAQVRLTEIARVNLDVTANAENPEYIGSNPSAVAWNGRTLFVAGYNNGGATGTGIVRIDDALTSPAISPAFGFIAGTPASRGYSGLDIAGNTLAAAYDDGAADPQGIQAFELNGTARWAASARGSSGVAMDPGFGGVDSGVAWTTFGSGRRALQDTASGAGIYSTANGMIFTNGAGGTFWRDMDFDDDSGNIFLRRSNGVTTADRTGGNAMANQRDLIAPASGADFTGGQNLALLSDSVYGDLLIYNDRPNANPGQMFLAAMRVIDLTGAQQAVTFDFLGGQVPLDGNRYYDFSWDEATGTLAVLDFTNRNVSIFLVPSPAAGGLLSLAGLLALRRRR